MSNIYYFAKALLRATGRFFSTLQIQVYDCFHLEDARSIFQLSYPLLKYSVKIISFESQRTIWPFHLMQFNMCFFMQSNWYSPTGLTPVCSAHQIIWILFTLRVSLRIPCYFIFHVESYTFFLLTIDGLKKYHPSSRYFHLWLLVLPVLHVDHPKEIFDHICTQPTIS